MEIMMGPMTADELWALAKHHPEGLLVRADDIRALAIRMQNLEQILRLSTLTSITRHEGQDEDLWDVEILLHTDNVLMLMEELVDR